MAKERIPFSNDPIGPTPKKPVARLAIALVAMIGLIIWLRTPSDPQTTQVLFKPHPSNHPAADAGANVPPPDDQRDR